MRVCFLMAAAAMLVMAGGAVRAQGYEFTALAVPSGTSLSANAVNNSGHVAGSAYLALGVPEAVIWHTPNVTVLNSFGGTSNALAINNSGQAAGYSFLSGIGQRAVMWNGGAATPLPRPRGTSVSVAVGINDSGQIAGVASPFFGGPSFGVTWTGERAVFLDQAGGRSSTVTGINNAGDIVGYIEDFQGSGYQRPVVWRETQALALNSLTETTCCNQANAINDRGQVVGRSTIGTSGSVRAVLWNGVVPTALTALSDVDFALGLNNVGQVVGARNAGGGARTAVLWDLNAGTGVDLNTFLGQAELEAGWVLYTARDINDHGVIVGDAFNRQTGNFRPFQLTPVPEQGTFALLLSGILMLGSLGIFGRSRCASLGASEAQLSSRALTLRQDALA
jgi:uncharacterized membrane protein